MQEPAGGPTPDEAGPAPNEAISILSEAVTEPTEPVSALDQATAEPGEQSHAISAPGQAVAEPVAAGAAPGQAVAEPVAAATVVLLRDGPDGLETLMLRRNAALQFVGGAWVFPGGRVDPEDVDADRPDDAVQAARNAAAREAREEADVGLDPADLVLMSRWCPPPEAPRRFDTWFFAGRAPLGAEVTVDGGEICDHAWFRPRDALARRAAGEIEFIPPTWVTLHTIADQPDVATALAALGAAEPPHYITRIATRADGTRVTVWPPDVAFDTGDLLGVGPRHRLVMGPGEWEYVRSDQPGPAR